MDLFGIPRRAVAWMAARDQRAWNNFKSFVHLAEKLAWILPGGAENYTKESLQTIIVKNSARFAGYLNPQGLDTLRRWMETPRCTQKAGTQSEVTSDGSHQLELGFEEGFYAGRDTFIVTIDPLAEIPFVGCSEEVDQ